jgi:hypothetical protein
MNAAHDFFTAPDQQAYLNSFGQTLGQQEKQKQQEVAMAR